MMSLNVISITIEDSREESWCDSDMRISEAGFLIAKYVVMVESGGEASA